MKKILTTSFLLLNLTTHLTLKISVVFNFIFTPPKMENPHFDTTSFKKETSPSASLKITVDRAQIITTHPLKGTKAPFIFQKEDKNSKFPKGGKNEKFQ